MKNNLFRKLVIFHGITLISILTALGMYGYIGTFNRLMGDSLCSYYFAQRLGLLRSIWYWRLIWSGRYSAYGFDWVLSSILSSKNVPIFIPVVLVVWIAINTVAFFLILKKLSNDKNSLFFSLLLGSASIFIILETSPYIQQSFYWIDGFRAYTLPVIALPLSFIICLLIIENPKIPTAVVACISFLMAFANGGLSETFAAFQFAFLILCITSYLIIEKSIKINKTLLSLISGLIGSVVALTVVITAPGNAVRQQFFPDPPGIVKLISISLYSFSSFWQTIFTTPEKIMGLIGVILLSIWIGNIIQTDNKAQNLEKKIVLSLASALLLSFACFPPGVYGYSEETPQRVLIIATFIQTICLMLAGFLIGILTKQYSSQKWLIILPIAFSLLFISSSFIISKKLYKDRDVYITYAKNWDATDIAIKSAKANGEEVVIVKNVPNWAGMDLLNNNPKHWVNECYSSFYGIQVFGE